MKRGAAFGVVLLVALLCSSPGWAQHSSSPDDPADMTTAEILDELIALNEKEAERLENWEMRLDERESALQTRETNIATLSTITTALADSLRNSEADRIRAQKSRDFWVTATVVSLVGLTISLLF